MNGVHDLGGMQGFGPIEREAHEPVFHDSWEGRVRAMMSTGIRLGLYNLDEFRWALERMEPAAYLASSYYEKWLAAIERLYIEKGIVAREELDARRKAPLPAPAFQKNRTIIERLVNLAPPSSETAVSAPRYRSGDQVRAKNLHPPGHTRLPRYVRGKRGTVQQVLGCYALPDKNAMGLGRHLEHVYSVCFEARELWGGDASPSDRVYIDLWESYLEEER